MGLGSPVGNQTETKLRQGLPFHGVCCGPSIQRLPEPPRWRPGQPLLWPQVPITYLVDEGVGPLWAEKQDGAAQSVPVPIQLLCLHGGEEAGEHVANVLVHLLQRDIKAQPRGLVQKALEPTDI